MSTIVCSNFQVLSVIGDHTNSVS